MSKMFSKNNGSKVSVFQFEVFKWVRSVVPNLGVKISLSRHEIINRTSYLLIFAFLLVKYWIFGHNL